MTRGNHGHVIAAAATIKGARAALGSSAHDGPGLLDSCQNALCVRVGGRKRMHMWRGDKERKSESENSEREARRREFTHSRIFFLG